MMISKRAKPGLIFSAFLIQSKKKFLKQKLHVIKSKIFINVNFKDLYLVALKIE